MCNCNVYKDCDDFGDDGDNDDDDGDGDDNDDDDDNDDNDDGGNGDDAHLLIACKEAAVRAGQLCTSSSRSWVCLCSFFIILGLLYFVFVYMYVSVS